MIEPSTLKVGAAVRLVAAREMSTQFRSKGWRLTTAITLVLVVAFIGVSKFVSGDDSPAKVGLLSSETALAASLESSGEVLGQELRTSTIADERTGTQQVRDGDLDALLVTGGQTPTVIVQRDLDDDLRNVLNVFTGQQALNQQIVTLGGDPASVNAAVSGATVNVRSLDPPREFSSQELALGVIVGILIYISLLMNGQLIAQGVVEEKSSRVVEILLSTIRPWQLMAGKVIGIGIAGLVQVAVIGAVGAAVASAFDVLTISVSAAVGTVIWLVVWFLLGYFLYALVFAALSALVSRQEEVGGIVTPAMMLLIGGYVVGVSVLPSDPDNSFVTIMSLIPAFSPTLMPMRLAMGGVPAWQAALSVGLVVALIPAMVWLCGRVYRNAVMRTGARVKFRDALKV